jgi:putative FmdB family regulatory protein
MPIYEYEHDGSCGQCQGRFEVLQGLSDSPLTKCPQCGKPCHRVFSTFSTGSSEHKLLSNKNLESHGFTKYERAGDGHYEKKCGKGPGLISGE